MTIFLRQIIINNLYYVGDVEVKWVDDPYDLSEPSPEVIGIIGTNGSGKSTILSIALPWLIHPESNKLTDELNETIFNNEVPSLSVKIVFEFDGIIYEAERSLKYARQSDAWLPSHTLFRIEDDGKKQNISSSWDYVFGKDTGTAQPYVCEHHKLAVVARKMASDNGLRDFSDNLGHHELLTSLNRLDSADKITQELAETSQLKGAKLEQYEKLRSTIKSIEEDLTTKQKEIDNLNELDEDNRLEHGDYDQFYANYNKVEAAESDRATASSRKRRQITQFIDEDTLIKSTMAKLKKHFDDEYGLDSDDLPTAEVTDSMIKVVKGFKHYCEDIYDRIADDDKTTLDEIIAAVRKLDLSLVKTSDPNLMGELTSTLKSKIKREAHTDSNLKRVKRSVQTNDNITEATLIHWQEIRARIDELKPELDSLNSKITDFEALKQQLSNHDEAQPKIDQARKSRRAIAKLIEILNGSVFEFEKDMQSQMLQSAEDLLNGIYVHEDWKITQNLGTILPSKNDVQLNLAKLSRAGGPSSGQARTIALCIMVERYLMTKCKVPLILDDAYKDISEEKGDLATQLRTQAETSTLHRAVKFGSQVIWVNVSNPLSSDAVLARITTKEIANNAKDKMSAPWNGEPVIGELTGGGEN